MIKQSLESNFVYLCSINKNSPIITCYEIGIVRGINKVDNEIYLLVNISDKILQQVNALFLTRIPIPQHILFIQSICVDGDLPYCGVTNNFIATRQIKELFHRPDTQKK